MSALLEVILDDLGEVAAAHGPVARDDLVSLVSAHLRLVLPPAWRLASLPGGRFMILATDSARVAEVTKMIHAAVIGCHLGVDHTVAKTTVTVRSYALSFEIP